MKNWIVFAVLALLAQPLFSQTRVQALLTENLESPLGLDVAQPRFSWQLTSERRNTMQKAYAIRVFKGKDLVWNSGKVISDSSVYVTYKGAPLESGSRYQWQVQVWDNGGRVSPWSARSVFGTGLFSPSDWKAKWIEPGFDNAVEQPCPLFRKDFSTQKKISSAMVYMTAHGLYEAWLNGKKIGDGVLTPGWTSYNNRLQYQAYDVTNLLQEGNNAVGVALGSGWYRSVLGWGENKNLYGKNLGLLFQLELRYTDGSSETILSDRSWKSSTGEIIYSEIYNGETIDARKEKKGWMMPGYADGDWKGVVVAKTPIKNLIATWNEPVKRKEVFRPVKLITTPAGEKVIDFGQNLVGWVVMKVNGRAGDSVVLSHAEVLDKSGNFYTANLRGAKAQNKYILKGGGEETFHPHFTWQGFRYLKIDGYPGAINLDNFEAVALYSDMKPVGEFNSSNALINQLQHNIQWGQRGNFLDVPTDCPQRDERLGWTGDAQAFSRTATFNMRVHSFFAKWLRDVEADQIDGKVPHVIPNVLGPGGTNSAGWADAATIVPWNMYLAYGDIKILRTQYPSMKAFVESVRKVTKNDLWNSGFHFGDWLFYRPFDDNDGRSAVTDKYLIAQCFYANSIRILAKTASLLGFSNEEAEYNNLAQKVVAAFQREYVTASGRLVSGTQTAYVLALNFDMLPESQRAQAAERLAENIRSYGNHLTTGFLGTPYLCHVLTRFGYDDLAYTLLLKEDYPSWLYPVKMGATTIWERWDGQKPDGSFQTPGMNSFNHYAYGAIGDWMYRKMAGIDTYEEEPGYRHILIKPHPGGGFSDVRASLMTYYGRVSSHWKISGNDLTLALEIPVNTGATVYLPSTGLNEIREGGKLLTSLKEIRNITVAGQYTKVDLGSGNYQFTMPAGNLAVKVTETKK